MYSNINFIKNNLFNTTYKIKLYYTFSKTFIYKLEYTQINFLKFFILQNKIFINLTKFAKFL